MMEVECCGLEGLIRHPYASLSITGITQGFAKDELLSGVLLFGVETSVSPSSELCCRPDLFFRHGVQPLSGALKFSWLQRARGVYQNDPKF